MIPTLGLSMIFTFCFAKDGKTPADAREQANETKKPVLFFEGIFRYVLCPDDPTLYDFTSKEDVFSFEQRKMRNDIIKNFGVDPETILTT